MIKKIFGNLWLWVVAAFLLVIVAWVWTIMIAKNYDYHPVSEDEKIERQVPTDPVGGK